MKRNLHRIAAHTALSCVVMVGLTVALSGAAGAASPPALHISKGPYHSGQLINVSVGPNGYYKPYSRINILECADPGGKQRNLPISVATCDGNTIEGNSILIAKDGSWSETGFQLFALPDIKSLGELANGQPVCNQRHSCVLYIGENQENFTWPKQFSAPFNIKPAHKAKR